MALSEFALIEKYFQRCGAKRADVPLSIGDDAAVLECPPGMQLVAAVDTLVEGVHFPQGSPARSVGHRALAVNLSDLAAMGAQPAWMLLALTLPKVEESWLAEFAGGLDALARAHDVALVGGDTTLGPLCISIQLLGWAPQGSVLKRSGGKPGDLLFVSGTPGDAAAGLKLEQNTLPAHSGPDLVAYDRAACELRERFLFPTPRVALGIRLRGLASACIDVSDGLLGDAGKLAAASGCALEIEWDDLPVSQSLIRCVGEEEAHRLTLTGGEPYELCFSVPAEKLAALQAALPAAEWGYRRIGVLQVGSDARVTRRGNVIDFAHPGYQHFG